MCVALYTEADSPYSVYCTLICSDMLYSISISSCGVLPIKRSAVSRLALVGNWSRRPTGKEEKGRKRENAMGTRS